MNYPNAYCVKCRSHTPTRDKHTIILQNNARAMLGVCPVCASENYKLLPKKKKNEVLKTLAGGSQQGFCFSCKDRVSICNPQAIVFKNGANAVKGQCSQCSGAVYRIISIEDLPSKAPRQRDPLKSAVIIPPQPSYSKRTILLAKGKEKAARKDDSFAVRSQRPVRTVIPMAKTLVSASRNPYVTQISKPKRNSSVKLAYNVLLFSSLIAILALIYYRYRLFFGG